MRIPKVTSAALFAIAVGLACGGVEEEPAGEQADAAVPAFADAGADAGSDAGEVVVPLPGPDAGPAAPVLEVSGAGAVQTHFLGYSYAITFDVTSRGAPARVVTRFDCYGPIGTGATPIIGSEIALPADETQRVSATLKAPRECEQLEGWLTHLGNDAGTPAATVFMLPITR